MSAPLYTESKAIPATFLESYTLTKLVNPQGFTNNSIFDTRTVTISDPAITRLRDEQILSRYVRGYFGGWAFFPERILLTSLRFCFGFTLPSEFPGEYVPPSYSSSLLTYDLAIAHGKDVSSLPYGLSRDKLPQVGSTITYGTFQVLASHIRTSAVQNNTTSIADRIDTGDEDSYVDIAAGRAAGTFTACHRYTIHRMAKHRPEAHRTTTEGSQGDIQGAENDLFVKVIQSDTALNPSADSLGLIGWMHGFHMIYARLLHWDGVREVLRR